MNHPVIRSRVTNVRPSYRDFLVEHRQRIAERLNMVLAAQQGADRFAIERGLQAAGEALGVVVMAAPPNFRMP